MRYIRKLVYKLGFRPKRGSILYSPSIDLLLKAKAAMENIDWSKLQVIPEDIQFRVDGYWEDPAS